MARNPMLRRSSIPHAPYYDTESYDRYTNLMSAAANDEERQRVTQQLRQDAMQQTDRIGSDTKDPDARNYNEWAGYNINDPNRPELPPSTPGQVWVDRIADYRTDQYLAQAAKSGELKKQNLGDSRSREYIALFGPDGPLGGGASNYAPEDVAKLEKEYRMVGPGIFNAINAFRGMKKKSNQSKGLSFQGPMSIGQANAYIRRMTGG
jgi:hypothetical protein